MIDTARETFDLCMFPYVGHIRILLYNTDVPVPADCIRWQHSKPVFMPYPINTLYPLPVTQFPDSFAIFDYRRAAMHEANVQGIRVTMMSLLDAWQLVHRFKFRLIVITSDGYSHHVTDVQTGKLGAASLADVDKDVPW